MVLAEKTTAALPPTLVAHLAGRCDPARLAAAAAALRRPEEVMPAAALATLKCSAFSFTRSLVRRMLRQRWEIRRHALSVASDGAGRVVYRIAVEGRVLTFAVLSNPPAAAERQGRFMENAYDLQAVLYEGEPDPARDAAEHREQSLHLWRGRSGNATLGWSFANRSHRFFDHVVERLAAGRQPDPALLGRGGGYILRNAGFYGNGRVGTRSWAALPADHPLAYPYHMDCFALYLWREAGLDLAEAAAAARAPMTAVPLHPRLRRYLGVGNSSGIGMVAALVRWPHWLDGFCLVRELCLALIKSDPEPPAPARLQALAAHLARAEHYYRRLTVPVDRRYALPFDRLADDLARLRAGLASDPAPASWQALCARAAAEVGREAAEQLHAALIELHPELVELIEPWLPAAMATPRDVVPEMTVAELRRVIERDYAWALAIDQAAPGARRHFWYRSEENGEQRRGERGIDPGEENETFVDVVGAVQALHRALSAAPPEVTIAEFLLAAPRHRHVVARVQSLRGRRFGEIRSNLVAADFLPVHVIRFFLTVIGLESAHPDSFRWVKGVLMQGAPDPAEIARGEGGDWSFPLQPEAAELGLDAAPPESSVA